MTKHIFYCITVVLKQFTAKVHRKWLNNKSRIFNTF